MVVVVFVVVLAPTIAESVSEAWRRGCVEARRLMHGDAAWGAASLRKDEATSEPERSRAGNTFEEDGGAPAVPGHFPLTPPSGTLRASGPGACLPTCGFPREKGLTWW